MYEVNFTNTSLGYTRSFLTKEYEGEDYQVMYLNTESLREACIAGVIRWPRPFNEWPREEILGIESKPAFFIRSFDPNNNDKDTITWMPSIFFAEVVSLRKTLKDWIFNREAKKQLRVIFKNGRHRTEFFRYLGAEYIPVLTKKSLVETLSIIEKGGQKQINSKFSKNQTDM